MREDLRNFLQEEVNPSDEIWRENLQAIIDFQDADGSFKLMDSYQVPTDVRIDFCHTPTYICSAILMKAFLTDETLLGISGEEILKDALEACCYINLHGDRYDEGRGQMENLQMFMQAGVREFLQYHEGLCSKFSRMMENIIEEYRNKEAEDDYPEGWEDEWKEIVRSINHYFAHSNVFVYGTLMRGESNHEFFLSDDWFISRAIVAGFDMYDIGYYPGIIPGEGNVLGELYEVSVDAIENLDSLEGEGSLYIRKCVTAIKENGEAAFASIYIYNHDVDGLKMIPKSLQPYTADWQDGAADYVWYVSYGSNMLKERFMHYIEGGAFEGGRAYHEPCEDTSAPLAVRQYDIPYDMYFRNCSGSWGGQGVSFLDITKAGHAKGVAYLITREQFEHVACQENGGCEPEYSTGWYDTVITIGTMGGYEVVTITNGATENSNRPSDAYIEVLCRGLQENYPKMTTAQIVSYLVDCESHGV